MGICHDEGKSKKENKKIRKSGEDEQKTNENNNNSNSITINQNEDDKNEQTSDNKDEINKKIFSNYNSENQENRSSFQDKNNYCDYFGNDKRITPEKKIKSIKYIDENNEKEINLVYLLDMTRSMRKYKEIILLIKEFNISLKKKYANIKFGYVLYRDYKKDKFQKKLDKYNHIEVLQLNSDEFLPESKIKFENGDDWAEDWANAYYTVSQIDFNDVQENIIIHICDAGAHSKYFSDYDDQNEQELLLKEALNKCKNKNLKIIGFLINNFSRNSFIRCQNYYEGYYDIVDLACSGKKFSEEIIQEKIQNALKNKTRFKIDDYTNINHFEDNFIYKGENASMLSPNELFFLPDLKIKSDLVELIKNKAAGIKQGNLGDCYLISSILSIIFSNLPIVNYFFPESKEYTKDSDKIRMLIFEGGIRKEIYFNNTYPFNENKEYIFGKPLDNAFFNICIERGYATYYSDKKRNRDKPEEKSIKSGYENIIGGFQYNVFNFLFGSISEYYNFYKKNKIEDKEQKISKENLKKKIIKYIDYKGLISCWVYFNILRKDLKGNYKESCHAYSVIGYKEKEGITYIEVLNPMLCGVDYLKQNIKKKDDYNNLKKKNDEKSKKRIEQFDREEISMNIDEDEFDSEELKDKFKDYSNTGYLIMKFDTFYKWISGISFCDPMMGSHIRIYEIYPNDFENKTISINFSLSESCKLKAYLIDVNGKLNDDKQKEAFNDKILLKNETKYKLILNNKDAKKIEDKEDSNELIYDYLPKNNYQINIEPNDKNNLDKYIYLKIQTDKPLNKEKDLNNGIIEFHPDYPHYYPISPFINGNHSGDGDNKIKYTPQMSSPGVIEKIVSYMLNIFEVLFEKKVDKKYYDYHLIERPKENSIYNISNNSSHYEIKNGKILFPNLHIHYINIKDGFFAMIINKYNFKCDCESTIKYLSDSKEYHLDFKIGTFVLNSDLKISSVDFISDKLFSSIKLELKDKSLKDVENILKNLDLKEKEEIKEIAIEQKIEKDIIEEKLQLLYPYNMIKGMVENNDNCDDFDLIDINFAFLPMKCPNCGKFHFNYKNQNI